MGDIRVELKGKPIATLGSNDKDNPHLFRNQEKEAQKPSLLSRIKNFAFRRDTK